MSHVELRHTQNSSFISVQILKSVKFIRLTEEKNKDKFVFLKKLHSCHPKGGTEFSTNPVVRWLTPLSLKNNH